VSEGFLDSTAAARVCRITLEGEPFALDVAQAREVVVFEDLTSVPRAPAHVVGLANLRGEVMPIVDARPLLGLAAGRPGQRPRTLVVTADGLEAALVIEGMVSLEAQGEVVPSQDAGEERHARWAAGFLRRDGRLVPLLDAGKLLEALRPGTARRGAAAGGREEGA
jgi:purine-binding chemotaxis protein CheW